MTYDSIVIGAGSAGMVAALQMKRSGLCVLLFEKGEVGGLLRNAHAIENYLGFSGGVSGRELISCFREHLMRQEVPLISEEVMEVGKKNNVFLIRTAQNVYRSTAVVIATGTAPKKLNIEGEEEFYGTKLFYEVADLPDGVREKDVVIIGGGDAAFDYALTLSARGHTPVVVTRGKTSCLPLLKKRAERRLIRSIEYSPPLSICQRGERLEVRCVRSVLDADYVFVAVGREPRYPRITTQNREGMYFVGDVRGDRYRQVHIAAGDALRTAMEICHSLSTSTS